MELLVIYVIMTKCSIFVGDVNLICKKSTKKIKIKLPRNFNVSTIIMKFLDRFLMVYTYVYFRVVPLVKANEVSQEPLKYLNRLVF